MIEQQQKQPVSGLNVEVSEIAIKQHAQYMNHEKTYKIHAPDHNITAFTGIHNTALGPGLGGIRFKSYDNENMAIEDVLRLSEAMTWKNAAGGLDHGGGKTVIMAPKNMVKPNETVLEVLAQGLNTINAKHPVYFGAEDMNCGEDALNYMSKFTSWLKGATSSDPDIVGGDPSPLTALGVFECIKKAAKHKLGKNSLKGLRVSMQGLGSVGASLAEHLYEADAVLTGCDMSDAPFEELKQKNVEIQQIDLDEIYDAPADIFAPNAIGGTLNDTTIPQLKKAGVQIICGAANHQQKDQINTTESKILHNLGILYCPDYIVNAGGVIWVAKVGENAKTTREDIRTGVAERFQNILNLSKESPNTDLATIAATYSKERVEKAQK